MPINHLQDQCPVHSLLVYVFIFIAWFLAEGCLSAANESAEDNPPSTAQVAEQFVQQFTETARFMAEREQYERQLASMQRDMALATDGEGLVGQVGLAAASVRQQLLGMLSRGTLEAVAALEAAIRQEASKTAEQTGQWAALRSQLAEAREQLERAQVPPMEHSRLSMVVGGIRKWRLPVLTLVAFWATVMLAFLPWSRSKLARRQAPLFGASLLLAIVVSASSIFLMPTLVSYGMPSAASEVPNSRPHSGSRETSFRPVSIADAEQQLAETSERYTATEVQWTQALVDHAVGKTELEAWQAWRRALRRLAVEASLQQAIARQSQLEAAELANVRHQLSLYHRANLDWSTLATYGMVFVHWGTLGALLLVRRYLRIGRCAKCNHFGKQRRSKNKQLREYTCHAEWDQTEPEKQEGEGGKSRHTVKKCLFTTRSKLRSVPKLYVPIIGNGTTGKSIWLAAAYETILTSRYDPHLTFRCINTEGSARLDVMLKDIRLLGPEAVPATQKELPEPVLFRFRDRDRFHSSDLMVNIFDYAGEVMQNLDLNHPLRRRMLKAHGILLLLDPTARVEDAWEQVKSISAFVEDAHQTSCTAPVAVCISKIDDLKPERGGGPIKDFNETIHLVEKDRNRGYPGLHLIDQRHQKASDLLHAIWPADLERDLNQMIGSNFRYFPLTSYGFGRPEGPGPLAPWGVLEPLLWLLHMNGYPTLAR